MKYGLHFADLGAVTPAAYGTEQGVKSVLVLNTRDIPCPPEVSALIRQCVEVILQTPYGRALAHDKEERLLSIARVQFTIPAPRSRLAVV